MTRYVEALVTSEAYLAEVEVDMDGILGRPDEPHSQQLRPSLAQELALRHRCLAIPCRTACRDVYGADLILKCQPNSLHAIGIPSDLGRIEYSLMHFTLF